MATTSFDPSTLASQLATAYTQNAQNLITTQSAQADATASALSKLQSALSSFNTTLTTLSASKSVLARTAAFDTATYGTATASATAQPGTYSFFVEQLATTHQVAYESLPAAGGGTLKVDLAGGGSFTVNLGSADQDNDGQLSATETALAINNASGNANQVSASVVSSGGVSKLVLTAGKSGADSQISLDTSNVTGAMQAALSGGGNVLKTGQNAIVWMGDQGSGVRLEQASNTFTAVAGVTINFTKAMAPGDTPTTLTVSGNDSGTAANVQKFIDAYNTLRTTLDDLTKAANSDAGTSAGAFASDASVRALKNRLGEIARMEVGGLRLADFGVSIDRNGKMALDQTKMTAGLAAHPGGLDTVFGSTSVTAPTGVFGAFDTYLEMWTNGSNGQIKHRQDSVQITQKSFVTRQTRLDDQYNSLYKRYLAQFTQLQTLQESMSQTGSIFDNLG
ncbi:MAG TPA: flagellar filament capping protein FliD [Ideonella sp.]|nr:flagellar filament capping protein FliD [Ideonella sp.]